MRYQAKIQGSVYSASLVTEKDVMRTREKMEKRLPRVVNLRQYASLMADETRMKILLLLYEEGKLCVCDQCNVIDVSISAVSQHLRKMKDAGIVTKERNGQTIFYSLTPSFQDFLARCLAK